MRRLGCQFLLLGYDEEGSHGDVWELDPKKNDNALVGGATTETYMNDEDEWEDVDGNRAAVPEGLASHPEFAVEHHDYDSDSSGGGTVGIQMHTAVQEKTE